MSHWEHLNENAEYIFGLIQVDIARHSEWKAPDIHKKQTKENLSRYLKSFAEHNLDIHELDWAGNGGSYFIPIRDPEKDYNSLVYCAIHFLHSLELFNRLPNFNRLGFPITIRISCHEGRILYSSDKGNLHGQALNYFLKHEREIGSENKVTITEEIYQRLTDNYLRNQFKGIESHEYKIGNQRYSKQLYRYTYTETALETMPQWSHAQVCGTYDIKGKNPVNKIEYNGELQIKEKGELLKATWVIEPTKEGDAPKQSNGTGLCVDNALAFAFEYSDGRLGCILYEILSDDHMRGKWGLVKETNKDVEECLKKRA